MNPKVSIVMASCNAGPYLKQNIESILAQTLPNFEFIIIDDASTDDTLQIVSFYKDSRIICLHNDKNLGQTASLNKGLKIARGEYIARMDADDIAYPQRLELQSAFLDKNPQVAVVGTWSEDISEDGRVLRAFQFPTEPIKVKCFMAASGDLSYWCMSHPTVMIRKNVLDDVGHFNEVEGKGKGYPQDYDLWARISYKYDFGVIGKVLLKYRILKDSDSRYFFDKYRDHRWEITQRRIHHFLPNLDSQDFNYLLHMLEYRPQPSAEGGKKIFHLFEEYMNVYLQKDNSFQAAKGVIDLMKLYYLPQLFLTNKGLALKEAWHIFCRYPQYLLDKKFYRKIIKTIFQVTMTNEQYKELCKKTL